MLSWPAISISYSQNWRRRHLVEAEGLGVRLERLLVFFLGLLDETKDMPDDVRHEVEPDTLFYEIDALLALAHVREDEALHGHGLWGGVSGRWRWHGLSYRHALEIS